MSLIPLEFKVHLSLWHTFAKVQSQRQAGLHTTNSSNRNSNVATGGGGQSHWWSHLTIIPTLNPTSIKWRTDKWSFRRLDPNEMVHYGQPPVLEHLPGFWICSEPSYHVVFRLQEEPRRRQSNLLHGMLITGNDEDLFSDSFRPRQGACHAFSLAPRVLPHHFGMFQPGYACREIYTKRCHK